MNIKEFLKKLRIVGSSSQELVDNIVEELLKEHPTDQSSIIRNLQNVIITYGEKNNRADVRNISAVELGKNMKNNYIIIPYI